MRMIMFHSLRHIYHKQLPAVVPATSRESQKLSSEIHREVVSNGNQTCYAGLDILTAMTTKIATLWDVIPHSLVDVHWWFGGM
jgi:hypothetical protein